MQSKILSRKTKMTIYKTIMRPVVTYGCEIHRLSEGEVSKLAVSERKIMRKIFGPVREADGSYRIRYNHELLYDSHGNRVNVPGVDLGHPPQPRIASLLPRNGTRLQLHNNNFEVVFITCVL